MAPIFHCMITTMNHASEMITPPTEHTTRVARHTSLVETNAPMKPQNTLTTIVSIVLPTMDCSASARCHNDDVCHASTDILAFLLISSVYSSQLLLHRKMVWADAE